MISVEQHERVDRGLFSYLKRYAEPNSGSNAAGAVVFGLLAVVLAVRLTRGVDFSDESYYAIFVDDWLKGGIATSTFLMLHQTAALIVYPAAQLYVALTGSSGGLLLFLRVLFLAGAAASAILWIVFLQRLGYRLMSWAGGILVLAFVPFGLPAPSYNTLGQQALTAALASFGCAALAGSHRREQLRWLVLSACAWAVAAVAYPSLIAPCGLLCLLGLLCRDGSFPRPSLYLFLTGTAICIGWLLVMLALHPSRLHDSLVYQFAISDLGGWSRRFEFAFDTFGAHLPFTLLFVTAIAVGLTSRFYALSARLLFVAVIVCLFAAAPALYVRSHDAITLATLMGLHLLWGLRMDAGRTERIIAYVYVISLTAALTMWGTSYYGTYSFAVGGTVAAALACMGKPMPKAPGVMGFLPITATIAAVASTSLFFYYGELPGETASRERIRQGFFAGLALKPDDAALVRLMQDEITPLLKPDQTVALIGRLPGLILATPARLTMPIPYPLLQSLDGKGLAATQAFYEQPAHRPSIMLVYQDALFKALNPIVHFSDRYVVTAEFKTRLGQLALFRKRCPATP